MLRTRKASRKDHANIRHILKDLDFDDDFPSLSDFWVGEENGEIIATARLEEHSDFCFLSAVGIRKDRQGKGLGTDFLRKILRDRQKDVYLYTVIPEFFQKLGFENAASLAGLPPRVLFGCERCIPEKCVCMRKQAGGAAREKKNNLKKRVEQ